MQSRANPRMMTLSHFRHNVSRGTTTLIGHVTRGPKSELHREVHIPVTTADLPVLRQVIEHLEADADADRMQAARDAAASVRGRTSP